MSATARTTATTAGRSRRAVLTAAVTLGGSALLVAGCGSAPGATAGGAGAGSRAGSNAPVRLLWQISRA